MSKELKPCPFCGEEAKIVDCSYYHEKKNHGALCVEIQVALHIRKHIRPKV